MEVDEIISTLEELNSTEQDRVLGFLQNNGRSAQLKDLLQKLRDDSIKCPDCGSDDYIKYGMRAERQRYKCKDCERLFTELTQTPLEGIRTSLEKFAELLDLMKQQASIRKIASELDISTQTAFRWRHKVMDFFTKLHEQQELSGIVEADETYLLHSKKGDEDLGREPRERGGTSDYDGLSRDQDCILTLKDRSGNIYIKLVGQVRPSYDDIKESILNHMQIDSVLCMDGMHPKGIWSPAAPSTGKLSREHGIERKNTKEVAQRSYHIQGINSLHSQIKEWLRSFHGIASKYIDNYLGFFAYQKALATS